MNFFRQLPVRLRRRIQRMFPGPAYPLSSEWLLLQDRLAKSERVIDLGCGASPHRCATVGVDRYLEPTQRALGQGAVLTSSLLRERGVDLVQADLGDLPFVDKSFDFAYSHHAFEHLPDPRRACREMCRVARAGAIITPSIFAEFAFGRPYHLWLVLARGDTLLFIRKKPEEDRPFGEHPEKKENGRFVVTERTNPFDMLLNCNRWYRGRERMPRLSRLLRRYWYSHSPVIDMIFLWEDHFRCVTIDELGDVDV